MSNSLIGIVTSDGGLSGVLDTGLSIETTINGELLIETTMIASGPKGDTGDPGVQGVPGEKGDMGYIDGVDLTFPFTQLTPSKIWCINHNLNKIPSVTVMDSAGTVVYGDVTNPDKNNTVIEFCSAFSGKASLN